MVAEFAHPTFSLRTLPASFAALQRTKPSGPNEPEPEEELRKLQRELIRTCLLSSLIIDLESTVETVYGHQEKESTRINLDEKATILY